MDSILVSVIIPVKNGAYWLNNTLTKILTQQVNGPIEIIIIDSGSTDETVEIVKKFPVKYICIPSEEFNHGETRNLGVRAAKGKYVVMTVQDAVPADDLWLAKLLEGFDDDNVAGVCGQQVVPHNEKMNPVQWFRPVNKPTKVKYHFADANKYNALSPAQKKTVCGWDNVNAMYRKDVLIKIPFRKILFGEDMLWAKDVLIDGYSIVYNMAAQVEHYHNETPDFIFKRTLSEVYFRYKNFGIIPVMQKFEFRKQLTNIRLLFKAKISNAERWKWFKYTISQQSNSKKAINAFQLALNKGESYLDSFYKKTCNIAPTPNTKINNE